MSGKTRIAIHHAFDKLSEDAACRILLTVSQYRSLRASTSNGLMVVGKCEEIRILASTKVSECGEILEVYTETSTE